MTRKQQRSLLIVGAVAVLGAAAGLVLFALRDTIVFFHTPSEIVAKPVPPGQRFRLGGMKGGWTAIVYALLPRTWLDTCPS